MIFLCNPFNKSRTKTHLYSLQFIYEMKSTIFPSFLLILLQLLSCYGEESIEEQNVSAFFTQLLQDFRSKMPVGIPELGLPIMDPYSEPERVVEWADYDFFGFLHSQGEATSSKGIMTGMSGFVIKNITTVLRTEEDFAYPGADLHFLIDFPEYSNTGHYLTSGLMPFTIADNLRITGTGKYSVQAVKGHEDGSPFPWGGSSHLMEISPWITVDEEDGTLWIQHFHGYFDHYANRSQTVEGIIPENPLIPITPRVQEKLNIYGRDYMVPKIDQAGRNRMYRALQDYIEWALQGIQWNDLINGNHLKKNNNF